MLCPAQMLGVMSTIRRDPDATEALRRCRCSGRSLNFFDLGVFAVAVAVAVAVADLNLAPRPSARRARPKPYADWVEAPTLMWRKQPFSQMRPRSEGSIPQ